jgi:excisionase family DNA binding protein
MKQMLTTQQAAARLGISVRRVRQLASEGRFENYKVGRDILIPAAGLRRFKSWGPGRPKTKDKLKRDRARFSGDFKRSPFGEVPE